MSSWNESNVCINVDDSEFELLKQICECLDINESSYFDVNHSPSYDYGEDYNYFGKEWKFRGTDSSRNGCDLFPILTKLCGDVQICVVDDNGSSVDDHVYIDGFMYDSKLKKKLFGTIAFCEGEQTVGEDSTSIHEALPWESIKEKIEERAMDQGIEISWLDNGGLIEPDYDNEEFYSLCDDVFWEEFSYWDMGSNIRELELEPSDFVMNNDTIELIKNEAGKKGYSELLVCMNQLI